MTRCFNVRYTCERCGSQTTAETGFGRWMRNNRNLDSGLGIVRTDTDHTVLRYKTHTQGREFQLMMDVEVKEFGADCDASQRDIFSFKNQLAFRIGTNRYGATTVMSRTLKSKMTGRDTRVRYYGYHLLQFEKTNPDDSRWIKWDYKPISAEQLTGLLLFELDPMYPGRPMDLLLRDRHAQQIRLLGLD